MWRRHAEPLRVARASWAAALSTSSGGARGSSGSNGATSRVSGPLMLAMGAAAITAGATAAGSGWFSPAVASEPRKDAAGNGGGGNGPTVASTAPPNPTIFGSTDKMRLSRRFTRRKQKKYHQFVIVGSGTAAHAAIEAIRQEDPQADILVLSDEQAMPRVDSSESSSNSSGDEDDENAHDSLSGPLMETYNEWRRHMMARLEDDPSDHYSGYSGSASNQYGRRHGRGGRAPPPSPPLTLLLDKNALEFDVEKNRILLGDGTEIRYDKCLIASAGKPRHFYVLDSERISYSLKDRINTCTTLNDFAQLDQLGARDDVTSVMVIGGGFLGTEVAAALATDPRNVNNNKKLKTRLIFVEAAPASHSLPPYLAQELARRLIVAGVEVVPEHLITSIKCEGESVETDSVAVAALGKHKTKQQKLVADYIVLASTHTEPNLRFGRGARSGFEIDEKNGGIVVNAQLEAVSSVFVAGNAASYYDPYLGRRRVDRYDHAVNSGLVAGRNMVKSLSGTGKMKIYRHQPMFRSNLSGLDVLIEGIGEVDSSLRTVGVWVQPPTTPSETSPPGSGGAVVATDGSDVKLERGVVYYLKGNKIMGILLWNASDVLESARQVMLSRPEVHDNVLEELKHTISLAPTDWLHVISG